MQDKVLVVDDDTAILDFAKHVLKDIDCQVVTMNDPTVALEYLRHEQVAVLISDNNMPIMRGLELVEKANVDSSETVKIIMSAYTDLSMALSALNQCQVFKLISKPWEPKEMFDTVTDALHRYHTLQIIKRENEDVLRSLAQTIELKDPYTRGHCDRVAASAVQLAKALGLSTDMQREIKYGSWLHDCGKIGVPEQILNACRKLETDEYELIKNHPSWGADVARKANLSEVIINVISGHHEHFDGGGYPRGISGNDIPIEARIVSVADVFDALSSDRPYRKGMSLDKTVEIVTSMKGKELDPALVDRFLNTQACIMKKEDHHHGDEILTKEQHAAQQLTLQGDFSIAGVNDQLPGLAQLLARVDAEAKEGSYLRKPYEIDLSGVLALDTSGVQLLAVFFHTLRQLNVDGYLLKISDAFREKIHLLGFGDEIFAGERL